MKHLELPEIARMMSEDSPILQGCRHLAEVCPVCAERFAQVEALMKHVGHWDPEVAVREGLDADDLLAALLAAGPDLAGWTSRVEEKPEYQTWGVAWLALERAQALLAEPSTRSQARDFALLAAAIAGTLEDSVYHSESIADLRALAQATAVAAAAPGAGTTDLANTVRQMAAVVAALEQGTGEEAVEKRVLSLLSQVLHGWQ
ncbi:MAG TPA: hypothetical protein VH988_30460 [Thermoanaerobaculia bacterium]|jgi:hypothetical protein|nr:hypothetical protein [Thermoanaerobaculia bacterium]